MSSDSQVPVAPDAGGAAEGLREDPIEVALRTSDGLALKGRWHLNSVANATVVLVHGFSASRDDAAVCALAKSLFDSTYNVLTYDARGHGGSEGHCGIGSTEHLDVACAVERASAAALPVVLIGVSMGGVAVVNYLDSGAEGTRGVAGAVLVSAPARWRMRVSPVGILTAALTRTRLGRFVAERHLRVRVARRWKVGECPEDVIRRIGLPVAVVHGRGDRLLAHLHGRRLHTSAGGPSRLEIVDGMGHGIGGHCMRPALEGVRWVLAQHHKAEALSA